MSSLARLQRGTGVCNQRSARGLSTSTAIRSLGTLSSWNSPRRRIHHIRDQHKFIHESHSLRGLSTAATSANDDDDNAAPYSTAPRPFEKLMAANRGEIATRIMRAGSELGCGTVGIYSHEGK